MAAPYNQQGAYDAPVTPPLGSPSFPPSSHPSSTASPPPANINPAQGLGVLPAGAGQPGERAQLVGTDDVAAADPLLLDHDLHPRRPFYGARDSSYTIQSTDSLGRDSQSSPVFNEKYASGAALNDYGTSAKSGLRNQAVGYPIRPRSSKRNRKWLILGCIALVALILAIAVPVAIVVNRKNNDRSNNSKTSNQGAASPPPSSGDAPVSAAPPATDPRFVFQGAATGSDGSIVTALNGTTFTYRNPFGGTWSAIPGDLSARAQDDVPPLSQPWDYSTTFIRGVNLGGWLNTEPFICAELYERYRDSTPQAVDEWTLAQAMDAVGPNEKETQMEAHYSTFITEEDFMNIAAAGLNWVRIPIAFWSLETYPGEPYYTGGWKHFLNALEWARRYGIRINLDLHATPGSQNGWDHSGRRTFSINNLRGPMGFANAQRTLNYIRILTQFISQPQYEPIVPMFGILNEPQLSPQAQGSTAPVGLSFYAEAYRMIRNITGIGRGPMIVYHDGFLGPQPFADFLQGADRVGYDAHPYFAFGEQTNGPFAENINRACARAGIFREAMSTFGVATGGEWSLAVNDCSLFLNGVGLGIRYEGTYPSGAAGQGPRTGSCDEWNNYETWTQERKDGFRDLALAWMDATQNFFFWTWKVRRNRAGVYPNPVWSYQLGLWEGWMPADPRNYSGACTRAGAGPAPWSGTLNAAQTGGPGAGNIAQAELDRHPWPPAAMISTDADLVYTATGSLFTLPVMTPTVFPIGATQTSIDPGNGWFNPADTRPLYTPIAGMAYPDAWNILGETILKRDLRPAPTPSPGR